MSIPKSHVMSDDTRLALLEQSIGHIDQTLLSIDKKFDKVDKRFDEVISAFDNKFDKVDSRLDKLEERQISNFKWLVGTMFGLFSGLYATFIGSIVAKLLHWI